MATTYTAGSKNSASYTAGTKNLERDALLQENGDLILQEDNYSWILLETSVGFTAGTKNTAVYTAGTKN